MNLQRNYARGNPVGAGRIRSLSSGLELEYAVIDISATGMLVESGEGLDEGEEVEIELEITGILFEKELSLRGTVVKVGEVGANTTYALSTSGLSEDDKIEIDEIIGHLNSFHSSFSEGLVFEENIDSTLEWLRNIRKTGD